MIDLNAYWQGASKYYRPPEFRYERPNANRPNAYVSDEPAPPGSARSVYVGDLAGEMMRRSSEAKGLVQRKKEAEEERQGLRAAAARAQSAYDILKTEFVEKYSNVDPTAEPADGGDRLEISENAKTYLADLAALERQRMRIDQWTDAADRHEASMARDLAAREAGNESAAAGWSMRFAASKSERIEAFDRFNEMSNRLAIYTAQSQLEHQRRDVRDAAVKAGSAALTAGLQGPALFKVTDQGWIDFDATGLGHLSPDARQAEQLKRLVEIMSVRNSLSPLKGAVAEALAIQNAYIAAHPVVAGTVVLPF